MFAYLYHLLTQGFGTDIFLTLNREVLGFFFLFSGYHKLFNTERHKGLVATLTDDHVPYVAVNQWVVPITEFGGGAALILGLFAPVAAVALFVLLFVATCVDGIKRVAAYKPVDTCDYVDDVLYLPEVLYGVMLAGVVLAGPGPGALT